MRMWVYNLLHSHIGPSSSTSTDPLPGPFFIIICNGLSANSCLYSLPVSVFWNIDPRISSIKEKKKKIKGVCLVASSTLLKLNHLENDSDQMVVYHKKIIL